MMSAPLTLIKVQPQRRRNTSLKTQTRTLIIAFQRREHHNKLEAGEMGESRPREASRKRDGGDGCSRESSFSGMHRPTKKRKPSPNPSLQIQKGIAHIFIHPRSQRKASHHLILLARLRKASHHVLFANETILTDLNTNQDIVEGNVQLKKPFAAQPWIGLTNGVNAYQPAKGSFCQNLGDVWSNS